MLFDREPAFWSGAVGTILTLGVAFGLPLTDAQTTLTVAFIAAAASAAVAVKVRPVQPAVFLGVVQAAIALITGFGLELTAEQVGAVMGAAQMVLTLIGLRPQVTPKVGPVDPAWAVSSQRRGSPPGG